MDTLVTKEKHSDFDIEIHFDECPESPREWDNLGHIVYWSDRYNLGDERIYDVDEFLKEHKDDIVLKVYAYIHSGIALRTAPFDCLPAFHAQFDSGHSGFIYVSKEDVLKEYGNLSDETIERVKNCLQGEIETFSKYLNGEVYGFIIKIGENIIDSCWGFDDYDYCLSEARSIAKFETMEKIRETHNVI